MLKLNLVSILCFSISVLLPAKTIFADTTKNAVFHLQDPKIINGTQANLNATRHQVSIRRRLNDGYFFGTGHICGGSLISENVVLCAAHCFVDYKNNEVNGSFLPDEDFIAVMGNLDRFEFNKNTLIFDIIKVVKNVKIFNLTSFDKDIALLMLNGTVPKKHPTVRPIILSDIMPLKNGTICQVTGWGKTEDDYLADILRTVDVPIVTVDDCRSKTEYKSAVREGMMCAGYLEGGRDACDGDSGGPLVCRGLQAGIVSWGSECAKPLNIGVYTDVAYYKKWILTEVSNHNGTLPKFAGDGVTSLRCSLILVTLILLFDFICIQINK